MTPRHIAIVGCGFTGTSALFQLVDRYDVKRITVFESSGEFGPGYAYQTGECPDYLMNNTTDTLCLTPDYRQAFFDWTILTGKADAASKKGHLPRALFGEFLADAVQTARRVAAFKGISIELIPHEVEALIETSDAVELQYGGRTLAADAVLLTTGRCPDLHRFDAEIAMAEADTKFFASHISSDALDSIGTDDVVYILGASLSAYDVINRLFAATTGCTFERQEDGSLRYLPGPNRRQVVLGSRSGRLKKVRSPNPLSIRRQHFTLELFRDRAGREGGLSLATLAALIKSEADALGAPIAWNDINAPYRDARDGDALNHRAGELLAADIRAAQEGGVTNFLVDLFADAQLDVWDGFAERLMTPDAERRYRKELETAYLSYGAPCPVSTAERLLALHKAGVLTIRAGVKAPKVAPEGGGISIAHRFGEDRAHVVIDATGGVNRHVDDPAQPGLTASLTRSGLLSGYQLAGRPMPGADIEMDTLRLPGARNVYAINMWLWGPGFFTSSAALLATLVRRVLDRLVPTQ